MNIIEHSMLTCVHLHLFYGEPVGIHGCYSAPLAVVIHKKLITIWGSVRLFWCLQTQPLAYSIPMV